MLIPHVYPDTARVDKLGRLVIGGCLLTELAEQFGTPLYVFDEATLRGRARQFVREFSSRYPQTQVLYASKAFMNLALVKLLSEEGLGLDVVSGGELAAARAGGMPRERVFFHGNNKTPQELAQALEWGIGRIVVDSFHELELLDRLAGERGVRQEVMLRLSPGIDPHTHAHTTTGILDSKFGFPIQTGQAAQAVRAALKARHLKLTGLHFHLGSPIFELEPYRLATELTIRFAAALREDGLELDDFSPGGGFAIAYTRDQRPPSVAEYAEVIVGTLKASCEAVGFKTLPRLVVEPGRAIVGPAGVAVYRVGAIKEIPGVRTYVSVDGGMGDNIRPALYGAKYEASVANKMTAKEQAQVTVAGKYCESGDMLVRDVWLPPVRPGDLIVLPASGAYCPSMASNYNLNARPAMVMVADGKARLIRRRETPEDMLRLDVV